MNRRLIIIISISILFLAVVAGGLVWAVKKQNNNASAPSVTMGAKAISSEGVVAPVPALNSPAIWYFDTTGRLFRLNLNDSSLSEFSLPTLGGTLKSVQWAASSSGFLATSVSDSGQYLSYYDSDRKVYLNLPANIQSIDWMPDSKRVVYIWKAGDNIHQSLVVADADGTGFKKITDVFWSDLVVKASPDGKKALLYRSKPEGDVNKIYMADLETGTIATLVTQGKNTGAMWLSGGNRFIYAQSGVTAFPSLFLYDFTTRTSIDLDLNTTIDKVTADSDGKVLYAAVPKKDSTGDTFIKLDLLNFKPETYFEPSNSTRAKNLMLISTSLYFVNAADGKIYVINK